MIKIRVSPEIVKQAKKEAVAMGIPKNSITRGEGNVAAIIGEIEIAQYIGARFERTFDYNMILGNTRIEALAKRCSGAPDSSFACSVNITQMKKQCDWYAFARVLYDYSTAWILGYLPHDEYYKVSTFYNEGDIDPDDPRGEYTFKADCFNLHISELKPLSPKSGGLTRWM
jgi:hypothetical protein